MLESDGSFYLTWKLNKNNMPIGIIYYLRLSQKQTYIRKLDPSLNFSNLIFMEKISEFLKTNVVSSERDKGNYIEKTYGIRTHKLESKLQLFDYNYIVDTSYYLSIPIEELKSTKNIWKELSIEERILVIEEVFNKLNSNWYS